MKKTLKQEVQAALALPTWRERVAAYLAIDPTGRPGAEKVRGYQAQFKAALDRVQASPGVQSEQREHWTPRANRWNALDRSAYRAKATGDDKRIIALARGYHDRVAPVYQSQRATIRWGGRTEQVDFEAYSKKYGHPARWIDPGVRINYMEGTWTIVTARGRIITLPLPPREHFQRMITSPCLDGDLYAVTRPIGNSFWTVAERFAIKRGKWVCTGVAIKPAANSALIWEHGATVEECLAEIERKKAIVAERQAREAATERSARKARLVARLCGNLRVTIDHARACGFCRAGIEAYCERYGFADYALASQLRATGDERALKAVYRAAEDLVASA